MKPPSSRQQRTPRDDQARTGSQHASCSCSHPPAQAWAWTPRARSRSRWRSPWRC
ncbi:hypothetical protein BS78_01G142100 [Paspalum vaginatum]|nr:hypothetical protein BS78_01G142100 [Paspalum vaginatum]